MDVGVGERGEWGWGEGGGGGGGWVGEYGGGGLGWSVRMVESPLLKAAVGKSPPSGYAIRLPCPQSEAMESPVRFVRGVVQPRAQRKFWNSLSARLAISELQRCRTVLRRE